MKALISVPDRASPARHSLARAAFCQFLSNGEHAHQRGPDGYLAARFPDDKTALQILRPETRAVTTGATTTTAGWASELVSTAVGEFVSALPGSAASKLISRGTQVTFPRGVGSVRIPVRAAGPAVAGWVAEADEIPAKAYLLSGVDLAPKKVGVLIALSRELARHSFAEQIFTTMLKEDAAFTIDATYFSADAATAAGSAGLLNGVSATPLPAPTGGAPALVGDDLGVLAAAANSTPGSSGEVMFVMAPAQAAQAFVVAPHLDGSIVASAALPAGRVIAVDPRSIVHGFGDVEITPSVHSTIHMSDTPTTIDAGTPSLSMFQTAMISLRMIIDIAFAKRRSGCVAWADVTWS